MAQTNYPIDTSYQGKAPCNDRKPSGVKISSLILHYTAENFEGSITSLTGGVSVHYLVPDPDPQTDPSYHDARGEVIFYMVDESKRAWHAGVGFWKGNTDLNSTSVGIEIVNMATEQGGVFTFPPYNPTQLDATKQLALDILKRYPDIKPTDVIGHSDSSPGRTSGYKSDPGAAFPWEEFYQAGIGAWYDQDTVEKWTAALSKRPPAKDDMVSKFASYGYDTRNVQTHEGYAVLVRAFQLHFRPKKEDGGVGYDGEVDVQTAAILYALVEKYVSV